MIMLASMAIRAFYVSYISIYQNQHDGGIPYSLGGHVGYITWYLTENRLPDFDVRTADQFWHPPLHYYLCSRLLKLVWTLFPSTNGNIEIAQLLPFLYITVTIYLVWRILCHFFKEDSLIVNLALSFVAFQPGLVIRSAMLNNDSLVLMLSVLSFFLALKWHELWESKGMVLMIMTALTFGLSLMAKKSGAVVALPIAILFLHRFFVELLKKQEKDSRKVTGIFLQFVVFLVIAAPVGLWWYVRNYALFGVPFDFFWNIKNGPEYEEYLGNIPALTRVFDFDPRHLSYRNTYLQYKTNTFQDINPMIALWKSAVSDVWSWTYEDNKIKKISYILLLIRTFMVLLGAVMIPRFIGAEIRKKSDALIQRIAVVSLFVAQLISYYAFCFEYPYVWTMDYRYVEMIILCDALFLCTFLERIKKNKVLTMLMGFLTAVFCIGSVAFFILAKSLFLNLWS